MPYQFEKGWKSSLGNPSDYSSADTEVSVSQTPTETTLLSRSITPSASGKLLIVGKAKFRPAGIYASGDGQALYLYVNSVMQDASLFHHRGSNNGHRHTPLVSCIYSVTGGTPYTIELRCDKVEPFTLYAGLARMTIMKLPSGDLS